MWSNSIAHFKIKNSGVDSDPKLQTRDEVNPEYDFYKNVTDKQRKAARKHNECFVCKKRLKNFGIRIKIF